MSSQAELAALAQEQLVELVLKLQLQVHGTGSGARPPQAAQCPLACSHPGAGPVVQVEQERKRANNSAEELKIVREQSLDMVGAGVRISGPGVGIRYLAHACPSLPHVRSTSKWSRRRRRSPTGGQHVAPREPGRCTCRLIGALHDASALTCAPPACAAPVWPPVLWGAH